MKFATLLTGAALAFANSVVADTEEFTMLSIHSTSQVHYSYVTNEDGKLYVSPYSNTTDIGPSIITDCGKLKFGDQYVTLQDDGTFTLGCEEDAFTPFGIRGGHVLLDCLDNFQADPVDDGRYVLTIAGGDEAIGIALRATSSDGSALPDFNVENCPVITTTLSSWSAPSATSSPSAIVTL